MQVIYGNIWASVMVCHLSIQQLVCLDKTLNVGHYMQTCALIIVPKGINVVVIAQKSINVELFVDACETIFN